MQLSFTGEYFKFVSQCFSITFRKPCIASLEIWKMGLWTVGPFDCNLIQMDDNTADTVRLSTETF